MIRFTFDEIKNFKIGDRFISRNMIYEVSGDPVITFSNFYNEQSEKIEWSAICLDTNSDYLNQEHIFVIQNTNLENENEDFLIYKIKNT